MEAYSLSTRVDDVNHGLPWLEVCSPEGCPTHSAALEEKFSINNSDSGTLRFNEQCNRHLNDERNYRHIYPPHLRAHEPLSFLKSGLLRPILDKFTFQSSQIFHRPPHHYSTQELIHVMTQGLVVGQDEPAVDDIELLIDLLNFNLDRYEDGMSSHFCRTSISFTHSFSLYDMRPFHAVISSKQLSMSLETSCWRYRSPISDIKV